MKTPRKKKKSIIGRMRSRPVTMIAILLAVSAVVLMTSLPNMMRSVERQREELARVMSDYSAMQQERNVLRTEKEHITDNLFVETLARREHGYGWYGETVYEVGNLADLRAILEGAQEEADE